MDAFVFREEEKPRFTLRTSSLLASLLLLLLFWLVRQTPLLQLEASELALLEQQRALERKELAFRFVDAPEDQVEPENPRFLSDAAHLKKSQPVDKAPAENSDPVSRGNTFELQQAQQPNRQTPVPAKPPPSVPSQPQTEESEPQTDEPAEPSTEEPVPEPAESDDTSSRGQVPQFENGPKPYRRLTEKEKEMARQQAVKEMAAVSLNERRPGSADQSQFHNPQGRSDQLLGLSVETSRDDLGPYLRILKQLVRGNWRIPNIARLEVSGVTAVQFNIRKDGLITDIRIISPSGYEPLDTSSVNAITNTYKAPPLPEHVEEESLPIKFGFYYNVRPRY